MIEWIKTVLERIKALFRRKAKVEPIHQPTELEKKLAASIQKRQVREGRLVYTRQSGPNMPKYQPCPAGHGWKRRKHKTMGGAQYYCSNCKEFFFIRAR